MRLLQVTEGLPNNSDDLQGCLSTFVKYPVKDVES